MSAADNEADACCAACGIKEVDDIKLKNCNACFLAKYCGVECQKNHRKQHKKECKERMAELREELLFKQPESSHLGDCPICFVPLAFEVNKSSLFSCCSVLICNGCIYANHIKDETSRRDPRCPFCREPYITSPAEAERNTMKRIKAGDRVAFRQKGCQGKKEQNYSVAVDLLKKAARMGDVEAHNQLGKLHHNGQGVERDMKKAVHHWEEAAIGGHPGARFGLGANDALYGSKFNRAVKHFIIAASQGHGDALEQLKELYKNGKVTKAELAAALRAYQAAVDSTKSSQREAAAHATIF
jgi:hypothetical protein